MPAVQIDPFRPQTSVTLQLTVTLSDLVLQILADPPLFGVPRKIVRRNPDLPW